MKITYRNGETVEAVLLAREGDSLKVAIEGADDSVVFSNINGTWVSDDCEPARIEFAWDRRAGTTPVSEEDCICPPELASRLIHLLYTDSDEDQRVDAVRNEANPLVASAGR